MKTLTPTNVVITPSKVRANRWTVQPLFEGVDRYQGRPFVVDGFNLAGRLSDAMTNGAAYATTEVRTDDAGLTYVHATYNFQVKNLDADLQKLGY